MNMFQSLIPPKKAKEVRTAVVTGGRSGRIFRRRKQVEKVGFEEDTEIYRVSQELIDAAKKGDLKKAKEALEYGAYTEFHDLDSGHATLVCAIIGGNIEIVKLILADEMTSQNKGGRKGITPMMAAAHLNRIDIIELLLEHNAWIETWDDRGTPSTAYACKEGCEQALTMLLKNGAEVDKKFEYEDCWKITLLMYVVAKDCTQDNTEIAKILIEHGADIHAIDSNGFSVLSWAKIGKNQKIIKMLEDVGAEDIMPEHIRLMN